MGGGGWGWRGANWGKLGTYEVKRDLWEHGERSARGKIPPPTPTPMPLRCIPINICYIHIHTLPFTALSSSETFDGVISYVVATKSSLSEVPTELVCMSVSCVSDVVYNIVRCLLCIKDADQW